MNTKSINKESVKKCCNVAACKTQKFLIASKDQIVKWYNQLCQSETVAKLNANLKAFYIKSVKPFCMSVAAKSKQWFIACKKQMVNWCNNLKKK